jgi:hypothetical protein
VARLKARCELCLLFLVEGSARRLGFCARPPLGRKQAPTAVVDSQSALPWNTPISKMPRSLFGRVRTGPARQAFGVDTLCEVQRLHKSGTEVFPDNLDFNASTKEISP